MKARRNYGESWEKLGRRWEVKNADAAEIFPSKCYAYSA